MAYDLRDGEYTFKYVTDESLENDKTLSKEHFHTTYELLYVMQGKGDFFIQHTRYNIFPHSLIVIKPGTYHSLYLYPKSRYERIVLRFNENNIPKELAPFLPVAAHVYDVRGTRLEEEFLRLATYSEDLESKIAFPVFKSQLNIIIAYLGQCPSLRVQADYQDETVGRIISYIQNNLTDIKNIDEISKKLRISKSLMQKRFYEHMQTSVMTYVRTQRCMLARTMIQKGFPATFASVDCGFGDYSSFYRAYTKIFGVPPKAQKGNVIQKAAAV